MVEFLIAALVGIASQSTSPPANCRLITPTGAIVSFHLEENEAVNGPAERFGFEDSSGSLRLALSDGYTSSYRFAELFQSSGNGAGLPVALGYCEESGTLTNDPSTNTQSPGSFDPASWPDHCFLLAHDGRRSTFRYRHEGRAAVFEPLDNAIWPNGQTAPRISPPAPPGPGGIFQGFATMGDGVLHPRARENFYLNERTGAAVILLKFQTLRSAEAPPDDAGVAICGVGNIRAGG